jgi:integrase
MTLGEDASYDVRFWAIRVYKGRRGNTYIVMWGVAGSRHLETRPVPASPELVEVLRRHIENFPASPDGRLFVTRIGRAGIPLSLPFTKPLSMGTTYRVWDAARASALSEAEYASPMAKRPYDLRHAAVSLWLNAGVPPTQVAEWAGHSVNVLLRVYAKCVYGQDEVARQRIEAALALTATAGEPDVAETSHRIPT